MGPSRGIGWHEGAQAPYCSREVTVASSDEGGVAAQGSEAGLGRIAGALLAGLLLAKLGVVMAGLGRGFELGDEGFFLLNLNDPAASPRFFEFYKLLLHVEPPLRFDVLGARILRLGTELLASALLVGGVVAWARRGGWLTRAGTLAFVAFCGLGALVGAASRSFSYNDLTNLCLYGAFGSVFFAASRRPARVALPALFLAGFLSGFQLFVKFPAAIVSAALVGAALAGGLGDWTRPLRAKLGAAYAAGGLFAVGLFVASNGGLAPLVAKFAGASEVGRLAGYEPVEMLANLVVLEVWTVVNFVVLALTVAAAYAVLRRFAGLAFDAALAIALGIGSLALVASASSLHAAFASTSLTVFACLLVFLPCAVALAGGASSPPLGGLALLLLLPLAAYAGTNVPFVWRLPSHALPAAVVLGLLIFASRGGGRVRATPLVATAALAAASAWVFVQHQVLEPYGLRAPLYEQTEPNARLGVRLDLATHRFLGAFETSLVEAGFSRGDPLVVMDYMPGLVFYVEGRSPGFPFYAFDRTEMNCFNLNRSGLEGPPFLVLGREMSAAQAACIQPFDPVRDVRSVRTLRFPYEAVYEGFGAHGLSHVEIFAPRD